MEVKNRRKHQEKQAKIARAEAQGRNLDRERKIMEENTKSGVGRKRRRQKWEDERLPLARSSFGVCLDCNFESAMTPKEINSLALQLRYCYSSNRRNPHPCMLTATSLEGETLRHLQKVSGFEEWSRWAFDCTGQGLEDYYRERLDDIVYLTSDVRYNTAADEALTWYLVSSIGATDTFILFSFLIVSEHARRSG